MNKYLTSCTSGIKIFDREMVSFKSRVVSYELSGRPGQRSLDKSFPLFFFSKTYNP